ncbi:hypothetical protein BDB01DRAFT_795321 [Pilobolus umbonatus]|nr:hypothetical protein BDB01DRAFT_795321 [Pilobolus umbonatus]
MPPLTSFTGLISGKNLVTKGLIPLSSSIIRQQNLISTEHKPVVTETAILNSFPRPNLQPTLHSVINSHKLQGLSTIQVCTNCSGPHSTEFCPC